MTVTETAARPDLKTKALEVHKRLCEAYDCPFAFFRDTDPLSELVGSLLSHRTKNADSGRALKSLKARFPSWEEVMNAPASEVEQAIKAATWPEQKAPRLQGALRHVFEARGELSLEFLSTRVVPK